MMVRQLVAFTGLIALCGSPSLTAQVAYQAAQSNTSVIPRAYGFFNVGFAEARLGMTFVHEPGVNCKYGECESGGFGFAAFASGSARKWQGDLFANLAFNPGVGAGGRMSYTIRQNGYEYDILYLSAEFSTTQQKLAELNPVTTVLSLTERNRRDVITSVGYNRAFGRATIVGIGLAARREYTSVGTAMPEEVCVPGSVGFSGLMVPVCSHRFTRETTDPLPNLWGGHARVDIMIGLAALGDAVSVPMFAFVGAGSIDKIETANTTINWAIGGAIVPAAYPGQAMVSLLAGFNDATDANGVAPSFNDRFVVTITVGLPFDMILTRR